MQFNFSKNNLTNFSPVVLVAVQLCYGEKRAPRLYGGYQVYEISRYPHQVSVHNMPDESFCGGSIISKYYVLTAGHCIGSLNPDDYYVRSQSVFRSFYGLEHELSKVVRHENYKLFEDDVRAEHDLGLLKLKIPFEFNQNCQPIQLYNELDKINYRNDVALTIGWGKTDYWTYPNHLRYLMLPMIEKRDCHNAYLKKYGGLPSGQICAGYLNDDGSKNVCHGDSGGPLIINSKIAGVATWVGEPCGLPNNPAVFTQISEYRAWINKNTQ